MLVGILELSCGATFGRQIKPNGKEGKLYYGIKHSYKDYPLFKTPYEIKKSDLSRYYKDKYVIFEIIKQSNENERPEVMLIETLGDTDNLEAFCKYRALESGFSLKSSWNKLVNKQSEIQIKNNLYKILKKYELINEEVLNIFTIDPKGCCDMDDGLGLYSYKKSNDEMLDIYIAITCVPLLILLTEIQEKDIIEKLENTCSLYLSGNVINMLPKIFAERICSLNANEIKPSLVLKIVWNNTKCIIENEEINIRLVKISKNFVYDTQELLNYEPYKQLFNSINTIIKCGKKFDTCNNVINDSHDLVAYLMTYMNYYVMNWLELRKLPCIYRVNMKKVDKELPEKIKNLEKKIGYYSGIYCDNNNLPKTKETTVWCHITSPMRRLADLTNMTTIVLSLDKSLNFKEYNILLNFRNYCLTIIERINEEYKKSKRVSLDCDLFNFVKQSTEEIINKKYLGIVLECEKINENVYNIIVYVEELSRLFNIKNNEEIEQYMKVNCKIILFDERQTIHEKVKMIII